MTSDVKVTKNADLVTRFFQRSAEFPEARPMDPSQNTLLALSLKAGEAEWLLPHLKTISASDWREAEEDCGIELASVLRCSRP